MAMSDAKEVSQIAFKHARRAAQLGPLTPSRSELALPPARPGRRGSLAYQDSGPFSSKKPPVGPSSPRVAKSISTRAPSSGERVPRKKLTALYT